MKWIGLTGSIGSGKSSVAEILRARGHGVVDADQFARQVIGPATEGERVVLAKFGTAVATADGHLDRAALAGIVFSSAVELAKLEALIHPLVQELTRKRRAELANSGHHLSFYDVPLLFEKKLESQFDAIVVVSAPLEVCVQRVMARNRLQRSDVEARVRNQLAMEEKIKRAHWTVVNDRGLVELEAAVDRLLQDIGRRFPKSS